MHVAGSTAVSQMMQTMKTPEKSEGPGPDHDGDGDDAASVGSAAVKSGTSAGVGSQVDIFRTAAQARLDWRLTTLPLLRGCLLENARQTFGKKISVRIHSAQLLKAPGYGERSLHVRLVLDLTKKSGAKPRTAPPADPPVNVKISHLTFSPDHARALARVEFEIPSAIARYDMVLQKQAGNWRLASVWLGEEEDTSAIH